MMSRIKLYWLLTILPFPTFSQVLEKPYSSEQAGIFSSDISVELFHPEPGALIFYTLDGHEPTISSTLYTEPILMQTREEEPNIISTIPTNPSLIYPIGTYTATRASTRGWAPPSTNGYKINVLRYKAFKPGFAPSPIVSQTFMIDPDGPDRYTMPILSISMDLEDLFSNETGIYVYGNHPDGNYGQKGKLWERSMSFEYFDRSGELLISQNCRTRIHGGGSRHAPKKTFRIYAEDGDIKNFKIPFFDDTELAKFKRILLKGGGHRPDCFPRDDLGNMLTKGLNVEQQHFKHIIVFVNGEYWGIHSLKERLDAYFIQNLYGIDDDQITILDQEFDTQDKGNSLDSMEMKNLESFISVNDLSIESNYKYVTDRIDVHSYIDYMCAEIMLSNEDWVYSNVNLWRKSGPYDPTKGPGHDGKFRWVLYDLDGAFGGSCANAYYTVNTLQAATIEVGIYSSYTRFFRGLLKNEDFKRDFINRMSDLSNTWFKSSVMHAKIDSIKSILDPEILENAQRWRYPSFANNLEDRYLETPGTDRWDQLFDLLHTFAQRRQRKVREHIMVKWGYADTNKLTIQVNDPGMGRVKVNSILINENLPGTSAELYPWVGNYIDGISLPLIAVPLPGYRFVNWEETKETTDTITWNPDGNATFTAVFEEDIDYLPVVINEVMLSNNNFIVDNFGNNDDWSELYNPNNKPINLSGCKLVRDHKTWIMPNETIIQANSYLIFWHDNEAYQGNNHVSFKLANSTDTLFLLNPANQEINYLRYPTTPTNHSFGRFPNGSNTYASFSHPTPLHSNDISEIPTVISDFDVLRAFPNPSNNFVRLNKLIDFQLYDLQGRVILSGLSTQEFDVSALKKGVYILRTNHEETIKIIVN